ncbi:unnamed protein product [Auanema sp. JU1783]|nr:unnamed protein product [Auanema sp. JU1783]
MGIGSWKHASSVIIYSKTTQRILMMKRGAGAKFMPNALVFPGGVATPADEKLGPATRVAALREVFEETGLLATSSGIESSLSNPELSKIQESVKKDAGLFKTVFSEKALSDLIPWRCWLTPASLPKRFMTDFYMLQVEGEPEIRMCEDEMVGYSWSSSEDFLKEATLGHVALPPPQVYELTKIKSMKTVSPMTDPGFVICPQTIKWTEGGKLTNLLPGDHLYQEGNAYEVPMRSMSPKDIEVDCHKPTHRIEYLVKPIWGKSKLFHHGLVSPYDTLFPN